MGPDPTTAARSALTFIGFIKAALAITLNKLVINSLACIIACLAETARGVYKESINF